MSNPEDFAVGWICALSTEAVAAREFLDDEYPLSGQHPHDNNSYTLGKVGEHNIVIAVLPNGQFGISSATSVVKDMLRSFPKIKFGLMVGIGGGAPNQKHDIRLGDVIVSIPGSGRSAVFQYDYGKALQKGGFQVTGTLNNPPEFLLTAVNTLKGRYESDGHRFEESINNILQRKPRLQQKYSRPDLESDRLYQSHITHPANIDTDEGCATVCGEGPLKLISRPPRTMDSDNPFIHYGSIASANIVMKDAAIRDTLSTAYDVLCFETEAAGLMNHFPCLVIRGICDYSDSHKNKEWQGYAAMAAAAYAKDLLYQIAPSKVAAEMTIHDISPSRDEIMTHVRNTAQDTRYHTSQKSSQREDSQERQLIIDWLTLTEYASEQTSFIAKRQEGTGEWLLNSKEFQNWLKQDNQTLFCPGLPGAGKTIMTSIVVRHLHNTYRNKASTASGVAYLYCDFRQHQNQRSTDLLLSLLRQLVQELSFTPKCIKELYDFHKPKNTHLSPDEISSALYSVTAIYSRAFIIVDALDECQFAGESRTQFLSEIFNLQAKTGANIFATSRFIPEIERVFHGSLRLEIRAKITDIEIYLDARLCNFRPLVSEDPLLREEVKSQIANAANGMFLLAQLYVDSLAYKTSLKAIRLEINDLEAESKIQEDDKKHKALDCAYEKAMERINLQPTEFQDLAILVLSWVTCTKRPLRPSELQHALAIEVGTREFNKDNIPRVEDMVFVCAGLVIVDEEGDCIRLVHYTTQEYFERTWASWFPHVQIDITQRCLTYLSYDSFKSGPCRTFEEVASRRELNCFFSYAAQYWGYHAHMALTDNTNQMILEFLECDVKVAVSGQEIMTVKEGLFQYGTQVRGFHIAAYFGLVECMMALFKKRQDPESKDGEDLTPLHWAAMNGNEAAVNLLLKMRVNPSPKERRLQTPLHYAVLHRHKAVVELLLEKGVNPNPQTWSGVTPLHLATRNNDEAIVYLLLEKGADTSLRSWHDDTALDLALRDNKPAVLKLMLERTNLFSDSDKIGECSLIWAAEHGHEEVVKFLLERGVNPSCKKSGFWMPLRNAARYGHEVVVRLLLEHGADINVEDQDKRTPLHDAATHGHETVVKLLLERGANPNINDKNGRTSLHDAAWNGNIYSFNEDGSRIWNRNETILKMLLEYGADPSVEDKYYRTPFHCAAKEGHKGIIKLLLSTDADLNAKDKYCRTPLHYAAMGGYKEVVEMLLEKGADPSHRDRLSWSPLRWAAHKKHEAVIELFLLRVPTEVLEKVTRMAKNCYI